MVSEKELVNLAEIFDLSGRLELLPSKLLQKLL
jgi:hypothetical protein